MKSNCVGDAAGDSDRLEGMTPAGIESLRTEGGADIGVIWTGEGLGVEAAVLNLGGSTLIFDLNFGLFALRLGI